ncbi:MAG: hypothetical protein KGJ90_00025 [Patescibacteria group bacterium]|nr:hypothetical protein [Patescibacteria group bacterium]
MNIPTSALIGAGLIAMAIMFSHRYDLASASCTGSEPRCSHAWVVDEWTGGVRFCEYYPPQVMMTAHMVGCVRVKTSDQ